MYTFTEIQYIYETYALYIHENSSIIENLYTRYDNKHYVLILMQNWMHKKMTSKYDMITCRVDEQMYYLIMMQCIQHDTMRN